jgi:hypothetical protein
MDAEFARTIVSVHAVLETKVKLEIKSLHARNASRGRVAQYTRRKACRAYLVDNIRIEEAWTGNCTLSITRVLTESKEQS